MVTSKSDELLHINTWWKYSCFWCILKIDNWLKLKCPLDMYWWHDDGVLFFFFCFTWFMLILEACLGSSVKFKHCKKSMLTTIFSQYPCETSFWIFCLLLWFRSLVEWCIWRATVEFFVSFYVFVLNVAQRWFPANHRSTSLFKLHFVCISWVSIKFWIKF